MRITVCLAALSAMVAAVPHAQVDTSIPVSIPATVATTTSLVIPTTSLNIPITETWPTLSSTLLPSNSSWISSSSSRRRGGHTEPIPIFSKPCDCPNLATVAYPCYATDALARCNFEENFSWVCWTSAFFGCPSPTRTCEDLYKPTPITGKHPCELGPNPEPTTTLDPTLTITSDPSPTFTPTAPPTITPALYDPALKGF